MLFPLKPLTGLVAGLTARPSHVPGQLSQFAVRSSGSAMTDQDDIKTYPPPNPLPDGMKKYEVNYLSSLLFMIHMYMRTFRRGSHKRY